MAKLYLISQDVNNDYDTYSDAVVCAETEDDARHIHPSNYYRFHDGKLWFQFDDRTESEEDSGYDGWTTPDKVKATFIGTAENNVEVGKVVCANFHAG